MALEVEPVAARADNGLEVLPYEPASHQFRCTYRYVVGGAESCACGDGLDVVDRIAHRYCLAEFCSARGVGQWGRGS